MKIVTKRIRVIQMTKEEMQKFYDCMERAREGHTAHYAEEKLDDGSFLGVSVVERHEYGPDRSHDKRTPKGEY